MIESRARAPNNATLPGTVRPRSPAGAGWQVGFARRIPTCAPWGGIRA